MLLHRELGSLALNVKSAEVDESDSQVVSICEDFSKTFSIFIPDFLTSKIDVEALVDHFKRREIVDHDLKLLLGILFRL